jgi:hypothetical protein
MSLSLNKDLLDKYKTKIFVETGTYIGGGIEVALQSDFNEVHSIEIHKPYYDVAFSYYKDNPKVHLHLGDSAELLYDIIINIKEPITFFLDGHSMIEGDTTGKYKVPLYRELEAIYTSILKTNIVDHIIMIDDKRMMSQNNDGWNGEVWNNVLESEVFKWLFKINPYYKIYLEDNPHAKNDIIVAKV